MELTKTIKTKEFFKNIQNEITVSDDRKLILNELVYSILSRRNKLKKVSLNFICTHNSRRSQLAQVWAHYAVQYFRLKKIKSFSGGTEVTAMHKNTVKTLQSVGFKFSLLEFDHQNPVYQITYKGIKKPIISFSKLYDAQSIKQPFIAITTCSSAHESCPIIPNAINRIHLPYTDPKASDDTSEMEAAYLETNKEIAAEMFYVFQQVRSVL